MSSVLDETSIRTSRLGLTQANGSRALERSLGRHGRRRLTYASTGRRAWSRQMNADVDDHVIHVGAKNVQQIEISATIFRHKWNLPTKCYLSFMQVNSIHGEFLGVLNVLVFCISRALSTVTRVNIRLCTLSHKLRSLRFNFLLWYLDI